MVILAQSNSLENHLDYSMYQQFNFYCWAVFHGIDEPKCSKHQCNFHTECPLWKCICYDLLKQESMPINVMNQKFHPWIFRRASKNYEHVYYKKTIHGSQIFLSPKQTYHLITFSHEPFEPFKYPAEMINLIMLRVFLYKQTLPRIKRLIIGGMNK